ncbi:MAG: hypothetical protein ACYCQJ_09480 [Nitrososphaerales archaeon]
MDSSKEAKILAYARQLAKEGEAFEKNGEEEEAIPKYIKAVDVLLVLAEGTDRYPDWVNYTSKIEFYQKRTRILIAKASMKRNENHEQISQVTRSS